MSTTTTVRLSSELSRRLDEAANRMTRGKSWIIARALDEYLRQATPDELIKEVRRQCRAANRADRRDRGWEQFADWPE